MTPISNPISQYERARMAKRIGYREMVDWVAYKLEDDGAAKSVLIAAISDIFDVGYDRVVADTQRVLEKWRTAQYIAQKKASAT